MAQLTEKELATLREKGISNWTSDERSSMFKLTQRVSEGDIRNHGELELFNDLRDYFEDDDDDDYDAYDDPT